MRYIAKSDEAPPAIRDFVAAQMSMEEPVNLDYEKGFGRKRQLLEELTAQQFGLCGYTGLPVDDRIRDLNAEETAGQGLSYKAHNEHIKAQSVCRTEAEHAGKSWGCEPCEDIDHRNIIAAIEVSGAQSEHFGAVSRKDAPVPLPPTNPNCESTFRYDLDGSICANNDDGNDTIDALQLNHKTLRDLRASWIEVFLTLDSWDTVDDLARLVELVEMPDNGRLTKFSFCIASTARTIMANLE